MRLAILTQSFAPAVGGIETVADVLSRGFAQRGHHVTVITRTDGQDLSEGLVQIVRRPSPTRLLSTLVDADVVLHNNPVTRWLWPSVLLNKPTLLAHHTWLHEPNPTMTQRAKRWVVARYPNAAVSELLANGLQGDVTVITNGYDDQIFFTDSTSRTNDLLFVGRLVSDKGCDLALDALAKLQNCHFPVPHLRIIGDGPELSSLQSQATRLGLSEHVTFLGALPAREVSRNMRECLAVVVPSRWREPFGLVALEAAASGCMVVAPEDTGLVEAAGPALVPFTRNNSTSLMTALNGTRDRGVDATQIQRHLQAHSQQRQIQDYLNWIGQHGPMRIH